MKNLYEMILKMHKDVNYSNLTLTEYDKNSHRDVIFMLKHLILLVQPLLMQAHHFKFILKLKFVTNLYCRIIK